MTSAFLRRLAGTAATLASLALAGCDSFGTAPADFEEGNLEGTRPTLTVINNSSSDIVSVQLRTCSGGSYGTSIGSVAAFQRRTWHVEAGCHRVRVTPAWGGSSEYEGVFKADTNTSLEYP